MTVDEAKKAIEQLKAEGNDENAILGAFYKMFQDDKLTMEQFEAMVNLMGYHLTDEFKAMSPEDQKVKGIEAADEPAEGVGQEQIEDAKEDEGGKEPETKPDSESEPEPKSEEEPEEDESEEEKRAMKLFEGKK